MTIRGPLAAPVTGGVEPATRVGRNTARRVIPLFRPYRGRVALVVGLIVLTSTIGIVSPLLIQAVFGVGGAAGEGVRQSGPGYRPVPAGRSSGWPSPGCCCTTRGS